MACACNDRFIYTSPQGGKTEYKSEVEAKAAVRRSGGTYSKK